MLNHVLNPARGSNNNMRAVTESFHIIPHVGTSNTGMTFEFQKVADGDNDLLNLLR